eukprot:gene11841-3504_t
MLFVQRTGDLDTLAASQKQELKQLVEMNELLSVKVDECARSGELLCPRVIQ